MKCIGHGSGNERTNSLERDMKSKKVRKPNQNIYSVISGMTWRIKSPG